MTPKSKTRKESVTHWIRKAIRERMSEIDGLLMHGPFPAPYTRLSDVLSRELAVLQSLLKRTGTGNKRPTARAIARHKAAQAAIDAHCGCIDDEALADQLFTAAGDALDVLAETPCDSDAEFVEKLRYLLAHETRIMDGAPSGCQHFGSILIAVDRHFNPVNS